MSETDLVPDTPHPPTWRGVNHLALITPDLERTVRFYGGVLGLPLIAAMKRHSERLGRHVMFDAGGTVLHFFEAADARVFAPPPGDEWTPQPIPGALQHMALEGRPWHCPTCPRRSALTIPTRRLQLLRSGAGLQ